ncbi:mannose-P-dolichol utilization defect 1 protein [Cantharellus anzutake]|uniref:mannose-P-dolichol utilization defect 1 protein n=1 Tax=Cantharellus anzutake TaxID=1750568 RepID=UPI0019082018|nr:mannose-P-dolichol utilization defect 1 protein [Cantharellus anzutake]KAF8339578.1 mannose-P-dolichol utilization defect 1 protein [Cantharellus anzutake]
MTSLTHHLPVFISGPITSVIGAKCYASLVEDLNIADVECIKLTISKLLGIGIVAGGSIMKIPQILLVTRAGTSQGLSFPAYVLETLGYAISLAYSARSNFPFSTYGENFFLTVENIIITLLITYYPDTPASSARNPGNALVVVLGTAVLLAILILAPQQFLSLLQIATLPISLFSKIPQIAQNSKAKSTGQLSAVAVISQIVGCLARLFTTATEVGDPIVLLGFGLALLLNLVIGFQMWSYWGKEVKVESTPIAWSSKEDIPPVRTSTPPAARAGSPALANQGSRKWARKVD